MKKVKKSKILKQMIDKRGLKVENQSHDSPFYDQNPRSSYERNGSQKTSKNPKRKLNFTSEHKNDRNAVLIFRVK